MRKCKDKNRRWGKSEIYQINCEECNKYHENMWIWFKEHLRNYEKSR